MDSVQAIAFLGTGIVVGAAAAWFAARGRAGGNLAALNERLSAREAQIADLQLSSRTQTQELALLQTRFQQETTSRATAEERSRQIPPLQELVTTRENTIGALQKEVTTLKTTHSELQTTLTEERKASEEKLALLNEAQAKLSDAFKALSSDALKSNNQSFLELAQSTLQKFQESAKGDLDKRQQAIDQIVKPVRESLDKFDNRIQEIEKARVGAYEGLNQQVKSLLETQTQLRSETSNLVKALGTPRIRGRWGEIQLKRVVELAGMLDHCDFQEQQSVTTETGRLRPDLIVRLPGGKNIVIDAKAPLAGYLEALEATDDVARKARLMDHARQIREHMTLLGQKNYWDQFQPTPEFVVLFLPGESFFSAALEQDPTLIEQGVEQRVILATPTTVIALLKAVAYGWRQESLARNAQEISDLGKELYKRISDMSSHFGDLGSRLDKAVESYNKAVRSMESRVLVSARRFHELESTGGEKVIEALEPITTASIQPQAPELIVLPDQSTKKIS